jgi:hypothetical protein
VPLPTSTRACPFLLILSCFFPFAIAPPPPWPAAVASTPVRSRSHARPCNLVHVSPSCTHAHAHVSWMGQGHVFSCLDPSFTVVSREVFPSWMRENQDEFAHADMVALSLSNHLVSTGHPSHAGELLRFLPPWRVAHLLAPVRFSTRPCGRALAPEPARCSCMHEPHAGNGFTAVPLCLPLPSHDAPSSGFTVESGISGSSPLLSLSCSTLGSPEPRCATC